MCKWLRCLVCLLVICALLINLSPLRVKATGAGLAGVIASASSVTVSAPLVVGASLIALGVMANNTNPLVFENVVNDAVDSLSAAGQWVADGAVELLRTVDEAGNAMYYAAGEMLESLRSWLFDEGVVESISSPTLHAAGERVSYNFYGSTGSWTSYKAPFYFVHFRIYKEIDSVTFYYDFAYALIQNSSYPSGFEPYYISGLSGAVEQRDLSKFTGFSYLGCFAASSAEEFLASFDYSSLTDKYKSSFDLSLGQISTVPIDGTSALDWAPEYQANRLKVIEGGNDPDPDSEPPNDGKWFWPIMLPLTAATLYTMSQADEWSGQTPQEFDDYSTNTEFEILDRPEFDGYKGIELAPITNPNPNPNPGTNPDPDTGGDTDPTAPGEPNPDPDPDPDPEGGLDPDPDPGTDPDANPDADGSFKPQEMSTFFLDLSNYFPFCIPFDLYDFLTCLNADPVAPVIDWELYLPGGSSIPIELDLSVFDPVAQILRRLELLVFCIGLAAKTRDLIKG